MSSKQTKNFSTERIINVKFLYQFGVIAIKRRREKDCHCKVQILSGRLKAMTMRWMKTGVWQFAFSIRLVYSQNGMRYIQKCQRRKQCTKADKKNDWECI